MTGKVAMAFEPDSVTIAVADILPMRLVDDSVRNSRKFQQIGASVREIGIVQPPIVARRPELKGKYLLLDGHLRIKILKDMKYTATGAVRRRTSVARSDSWATQRRTSIQRTSSTGTWFAGTVVRSTPRAYAR